MMGLPFLFATPLFLCEDSKDPLIFYNCFEAEACNHNNGFKIDENISDSTISSDFLLFCDRRFWIGLCESLFFLGFYYFISHIYLFKVKYIKFKRIYLRIDNFPIDFEL